MQILESSRPIRKCEHLPRRILHFQAGVSAQRQALGNISEFTAYVRACVCVCECVEKEACVCVCVVRTWARFLCLCVQCVRDLTVGFPFDSVYAFFWRIGQTFVTIISF